MSQSWHVLHDETCTSLETQCWVLSVDADRQSQSFPIIEGRSKNLNFIASAIPSHRDFGRADTHFRRWYRDHKVGISTKLFAPMLAPGNAKFHRNWQWHQRFGGRHWHLVQHDCLLIRPFRCFNLRLSNKNQAPIHTSACPQQRW